MRRKSLLACGGDKAAPPQDRRPREPGQPCQRERQQHHAVDQVAVYRPSLGRERTQADAKQEHRAPERGRGNEQQTDLTELDRSDRTQLGYLGTLAFARPLRKVVP